MGLVAGDERVARNNRAQLETRKDEGMLNIPIRDA